MNFTLTTKPSKNYELLDSGLEEKLERFGEVIVSRPDPQALWQKKLPESEWKKADAVFFAKWGKGSLENK
jgi:23S rRNA (cytosine1962-C5)-methyltransferase